MRKLLGCAAIGILLLGIFSRTHAWFVLSSTHYLPHRTCYLAQPWLIWTNFAMDGLIAASYVMIFGWLFWMAAKLRRQPELQGYLWILICFGTFILACSATHLMEIVTIWSPIYGVSVAVKTVCAIASIATAVLLSRAAPAMVNSIGQFLQTVWLSREEQASDVSRRKQAEEMRERLAAIVDSSDDAIVSVDLEGVVIAWNRGAERLSGYSADEALGKHIGMMAPAERATEDAEIVERVGRGESLEHFETIWVRHDGRQIHVSVTVSPIRDSDGRIVGVSRIARDITEQKRAEAALQQSEQRFHALANGIPQMAFIANPDGFISWYNRRWYEYTGTTFEQMQGWGWQRVHDPDFLPLVVDRWKDAIARGAAFDMEFPLRRADGEFRTFLSRVLPLKDAAGQVVRWFGTNTDISERKQGEQRLAAQAAELASSRQALDKLNEELEQRIAERTAQLETANRELEAFTYSVSHDLRAPLRHISGFSRILLNDFRSSLAAEAIELLERVEEATIRMGKLIDGLLSLARLGRQSLNLRQNEMNAIVDQVVAILQPECEGREVEWRIARLPALPCDAVLVAQVFQNLLHNALKYSRRCPKAVIEIDSVQRPGEPVAIFVRDNGAGFNMKYAGRLFGVFQRLHTEAEFEGMGVGLATVHRIIQKHGGTLWADAEIGCGATFYFTLGGSETGPTAQTMASVG